MQVEEEEVTGPLDDAVQVLDIASGNVLSIDLNRIYEVYETKKHEKVVKQAMGDPDLIVKYTLIMANSGFKKHHCYRLLSTWSEQKKVEKAIVIKLQEAGCYFKQYDVG